MKFAAGRNEKGTTRIHMSTVMGILYKVVGKCKIRLTGGDIYEEKNA